MSIEIQKADYDRYHQIFPSQRDKDLCGVLKAQEFLIGNLFFEIVAFGFQSIEQGSYVTDFILIVNRGQFLFKVYSEVDGFQKAIEFHNGNFMGIGNSHSFGG